MADMGKPEPHEFCVYTIRHSKDLKDCIKSGGKCRFEGNQKWVSGLKILDEAREQGKVVFLLFAGAEGIGGVTHYAEVDEINIGSDKTEYSFHNLRKLNSAIPLTELILKNYARPMSEDDIRPYRILITPEEVIEQWKKC